MGATEKTGEKAAEEGSDAAEQATASAAETAEEEQCEGDGADAEYQHECGQHTL
jgi:hypothetical protein